MGYNHNRYARRIAADTIGLYDGELNEALRYKYASGASTIMGQGATGDDLIIIANYADDLPSIKMLGNSNLRINSPYIQFEDTANIYGYFDYNNAFEIGVLKTDKDLKFVPNGTGKVRFGTHTALGAETVTGYITIKDSGGTERKIAVVS